MRGDQLARQWRIIRAKEADPNGLTVTAIAQREETGMRTINRPLEAPQASGYPLYTERVDRANRSAFVDIFKFKIPPFISRKAAKFAKKSVLHLLPLNIYLVQFLGRVSQLGKRTFAFFVPWPEQKTSFLFSNKTLGSRSGIFDLRQDWC
jgi:hypothetical protein